MLFPKLQIVSLISCHLVWSWRNKERHNSSLIRPNAPALVALRNSRNYRLVVIVEESNNSLVGKLHLWVG
jgi:hypothetical protein